jgi:deoxyribose-phosphate aldolase
MQQKELDLLVETIAAQVRARLDAASGCDGCQASASDCSACGKCASRRESDTRNIIHLGAARVATGLNTGGVANDLARYIDHTLLKPEATREELRKLCEEARRHNFYSVCVNSSNVKFCRGLLAGSNTKVIAVVGFPLGAMATGSKAYEAREAVRDGAEEIDMVINTGELKSRNYQVVYEDIQKVVEASRPKPVKVIIESGGLNDEEKVVACALSKAGGAHFVKTSTGFGPGGATAADVALMKRVVGPAMEVKASGGVRDTKGALEMIQAGATRIVASASIAIVTNQKPTKAGNY